MSVFDPATFSSMTFNEANSTESVPVPEGDWPGTISKYEITEWKSSKDESKAGLKLTILAKIVDDRIKAITGRPESTVRYETFLDTTPEGGLDFGKGMNVGLGRAREAMNLNRPGAPFSFDMMVGQPVIVSVKHELYKEQKQAKAAAFLKPQ